MALEPTVLTDALRTREGPSTPEQLFATLELDEAAVDDFFDALRSAVRIGRVAILRPDDSVVLIASLE